MAKLNTVKTSTTQRVLIYGEPKSGKTQLAGMLAEAHNLLWFDLENGFSTLFKLPENVQSNIELIRLPDTKTYPIGIETILKVLTGSKVAICDEHGKVACPICKREEKAFTEVDLGNLPKETIVVIDSLSQLSNSAMAHLTKGKDDTYKPEWQDYANQGALLNKVLSQLQQAPYNVIAITHVIETQLEDGSTKLVPLCGTTAFSRNTAKYFDHVVLAELKNKQHKTGSSTDYSMRALTGSRTDITLENGQTLFDVFSATVGDNSKPSNAGDTNLAAVKAKALGQTPATNRVSAASLMRKT